MTEERILEDLKPEVSEKVFTYLMHLKDCKSLPYVYTVATKDSIKKIGGSYPPIFTTHKEAQTFIGLLQPSPHYHIVKLKSFLC